MTKDHARLVSIVRTVIAALDCKRDRFGRLDRSLDHDANIGAEKLRQLAVDLNIPHGGADIVDKAVMVMQAAIGDEPRSLLDR